MSTLTWIPRGTAYPVMWLAHVGAATSSVGRVLRHNEAYWYEPSIPGHCYSFYPRAIKLEGIDTLEDALSAAGMLILLRLKENEHCCTALEKS